MAIFMDKQASRIDYNHREFIADTEADIVDLPTENIAPGSTCFVIKGSKVFMLNTEGEWKEV